MTEKDRLNKAEEYILAGHKYLTFYESNVSYSNRDTLIDVIKNFQASHSCDIFAIFDVEKSIMYKSKENDVPDCRGNYNRSIYDPNNNLIFNIDDLTPPILKLKPNRIRKDLVHFWLNRNGSIYECGQEEHRWLANELIISGTIPEPIDYNEHRPDESLIEQGWIKVSSKRIRYRCKLKPTMDQINKLEKWMNVVGDEQYEIIGIFKSKERIIDFLKNDI